AKDAEEVLTRGPMGTPRYMAPEQWRNGSVDERTDVWGLGVTLYELLALRPAFEAASHEQEQRRILHEEPVPLRVLVDKVPADVVAVCRKAMCKTAAGRYAAAQEMADDLRRWLRHEPTEAHPRRTLRRPWFWARRNMGWAGTLAVLALTLVGLSVMSFL